MARFTVTALGSDSGRSPAQVIGDLVRYLHRSRSRDKALPQHMFERGKDAGLTRDQVGRYYADSGEGPGRWIGLGSVELGLAGAVSDRDFAEVIAGRHPVTGERLLSARGSSGRKDLAVGTPTRFTAQGEPLFDARDSAVLLGLTAAEARDALRRGERHAVEAMLAMVTATLPPRPPGGSMLVPILVGETMYASSAELDRYRAEHGCSGAPGAVLAGGESTDEMTLAEAAELSGLSARYLRRLCRRWEQDQTRVAGNPEAEPARSSLRCERGPGGRFVVTRGSLADFLAARMSPAVRLGYDVTFTTEKSVSLLALLATEDVSGAVLRAVTAANDEGISLLEQRMTTRRRGRRVYTSGVTAASFQHLTSRSLDPFVHHHNVVANTAADDTGVRRALDARCLYLHAREASLLSTCEMRHRLTSDLGVDWTRSTTGAWEIAGIPHEAIREFSRRASDIAEAVTEIEQALDRRVSIRELRQAVLATRPAKRSADPRTLAADWSSRAARSGLDGSALAATLARREADDASPELRSWLIDHLAGPDGVAASRSVFTRVEVIDALTNCCHLDGRLVLLPASAVASIADEFLASAYVVPLSDEASLRPAIHRRDGAKIEVGARIPRYTTQAALQVQRRIIDMVTAGRSRHLALVPSEVVERVLDEGKVLSEEQRSFVRALVVSGHQVQCAIGRPGAGKTTTMRVAAAAWRSVGHHVLGAAVKGSAARHLQDETGIVSETVAWYLAHRDPVRSPFDSRTVLLVDEASTLGDRDLLQLVELAAASGAAVRLIGDPDQHSAVPAGGMFRLLARRFAEDTPELETMRRVRHRHDREAAAALRAGDVRAAVDALREGEHLHVDAAAEAQMGVLERWWEAWGTERAHPMVDRRNSVRRTLNALAHGLLQAEGTVAADEMLVDGRGFAVGDRVVAREGCRDLHPVGRPEDYVRNGALGVIARLRPGRSRVDDVIVVRFDDLGDVDLPRSFFDRHRRGDRDDVGLDHAYALTSYAVQGLTLAESTSLVDEGTTFSELYVDITRGRDANHVFVTSHDSLAEERLPRPSSPDPLATVMARLDASGPERAAADVDPGVLDVARMLPSMSSAEVRAARMLRPDDRVLAEIDRAATRQVRHAAAATTPMEFSTSFPPRPAVPYLARRWDTAVRDAASYMARWEPPVTGGPWGWAVGPVIGGDEQQAERAVVVDRLASTGGAIFARSLARGPDPLEEWQRRHIEHLLAWGRGAAPADELRAVHRSVASWRAEHPVPPSVDAKDIAHVILGPQPTGPDSELWARLARELGGAAPVVHRVAQR